MKHLVCFFVGVLCFATPLLAVDYALPYLTYGGAPNYYLASQTFGESGLGIFENDAAIAPSARVNTAIFHTTLFESLQANSALIGFSFKKTRIQIAASRLYQDNMNKTAIKTESPDDEFVVVGRYAYQNLHAKINLQRDFNKRVTVGLSANHYQTELSTYKGNQWNLSAGIRLKGKWISLAGSLQNILSKPISFTDTGSERIPRVGVVSAKLAPVYWFHIYPRFIVLTNSSYNRSRNTLYSLGVTLKPFRFFSVSAAVFEQFKGLETKQRLALGTELNLGGLNINYVFRTTDYTENTASHMASLSFAI